MVSGGQRWSVVNIQQSVSRCAQTIDDRGQWTGRAWIYMVPAYIYIYIYIVVAVVNRGELGRFD